MTVIPSKAKDPQAVLDYKWDWAASEDRGGPWLQEEETITTATVTVPAGLTLDTPATHDDTTVTAWLSGGTVGKKYRVVCHIVTSGGREEDRSLNLTIRNR